MRIVLHLFDRLLVRPADPSSEMSSLKWGNLAVDTSAVEGNAAEHLFDRADEEAPVAADEPAPRERPDLAGPPPTTP